MDYPCSDLRVGQSCTRQSVANGLYSSHTGSLTIRRTADLEWEVTGQLRVVPVLPPMPVPDSPYQCAQTGVACAANSYRDVDLRADLVIQRPGNYRMTVTCSGSGDAKWAYGVPGTDSPTSHTQMGVWAVSGSTEFPMPGCHSPDFATLRPPGWTMAETYRSDPLPGAGLIVEVSLEGYGRAYNGPGSGYVPFTEAVEVRNVNVSIRAEPVP